MSDETEQPVEQIVELGEPGEHPLSILLFSWTRGKIFKRVFAIGLILAGAGLIGYEVWAMHRPPRDITGAPGFHAAFGFLAFAIAVLSGWPLGRLLRRGEDYYDARSGEAGRDR